MNCVHMDKHINYLCDGICNSFVVNGNVDWKKLTKYNNTMILIACRKVHFKTGKVKCHEKLFF